MTFPNNSVIAASGWNKQKIYLSIKIVSNAVPRGIYSSDTPQFWHHHACYKYNFYYIQAKKIVQTL